MVVPRSRSTAPPSTSSRPAPAGWDRVTLLPGLAFSISGSRRAPGFTRRTTTAATVADTTTIGTTTEGGLASQNGPQGTGESREHVLAIERILLPQDRKAPIAPVHPGLRSLGVDHPHDPGPGREPIGDLGEHVRRAVVGR